ncbi:MAG: gas vesicle protein [Gemmatimonadaceae bacterium]
MEHDEDEIDDEQLILGDLLNHVLDKGVVITGSVTISIADIDLLIVDLRLLLSSVETSLRHGIDQTFRLASGGSVGDPTATEGGSR